MSKPIVEYRMVCAKFGTTSRHTAHAWMKKTKEKVDKAVNDANGHTSTHRSENSFHYYEMPYRSQERTVTKWKDT